MNEQNGSHSPRQTLDPIFRNVLKRLITSIPSPSVRNSARGGLYRLRAAWAWEMLVERGDTIVQIGAPRTKTLSRLLESCGPNGTVVAIEAVSENHLHLEQFSETLRPEQADSLVLIHRAAYSERCQLEMRLTDGKAGHKLSGLDAVVDVPPGTEFDRTEVVQADRLDAALGERGIEHVNLLIVTVNGAEYEVLKGAQGTLASMPRHGRVFVKTHAQTGSGATIFDDVAPFLASRGFRVQRTRRSHSNDPRWGAFREGDAFAHKS
jgi:FkbM family methyltransferase